MNSSLEGTGVALATPFKEDNSIDFNDLKKLLDHVSNNGVDYLVVNGTTGESGTTSLEEKRELLAFAKKENKSNLPIVFGLGSNNTAEAVKKFDQFDLDGVSAILSVTPYYNKPSQEGLYQHFKAVAEASPVPIILYNVPGRSGCNMNAQTTARLAEIDKIIGVKEASGDMAQAVEISKIDREDFLLISGDDLLTLPLISVGGKGVISVLANAFPSEFSGMVRDALNSDIKKAADTLRKLATINPCIYEQGNPVGIKTTLEVLGICDSRVRLPLVKGSDDLKKRIQSCVSSIV